MLYYNIYDMLTASDISLIIEGLKFYREMALESKGDVDVLELWDHNPYWHETKCEMRLWGTINWDLECLGKRFSLSDDQLQRIYNVMDSAIDQYDATNGEAGILANEDEYRLATHIRTIAYRVRVESQMQLPKVLLVLAHALQGCYGANCADSDFWPSMMEYCATYMPAVDEWSAMIACAMACIDKHSLRDDVFEMADVIYDTLNK